MRVRIGVKFKVRVRVSVSIAFPEEFPYFSEPYRLVVFKRGTVPPLFIGRGGHLNTVQYGINTESIRIRNSNLFIGSGGHLSRFLCGEIPMYGP